MLEPDERHPDGTFVEDTAVVSARVAIATRPGAPTRAGEVPAVAAALREFRPQLESIAPPGTLDGGDVCQMDDHFLIGISERTNLAGAQQLAGILGRHGYSSLQVDIRGLHTLLHLKSGVSYLGERRFTVTADAPDLGILPRYEQITVDAAEAYAANCVLVNGLVLLAAGFPRVAARLGELGYTVRSLEVSEFRKMDGGLSCLSVRF